MADQTRIRGVHQLTDGALASRAADGDPEAFRQLITRHSSLLRAYVTRIVRSAAEADDVVQEAFLIAWRRLPELRNPEAVKAWLMRIASREAFSHLRHRNADMPLDQIVERPSPTLQPEARVVHDLQLQALATALDRLPEAQRQSWLLREMAGLGYAEIAEELSVPVSTVRGMIARARASILVQMEAWR